MKPSVLAILLTAVVVCLAQEDNGKKPSPPRKLQDGKDLPGPFHPFNLNREFKSRFHCVVSQHGIHPAVLILSRDVEVDEPLQTLLKKLDELIEKKPIASLGSFLVFVPPELKNVVEEDKKRVELAQKAEDACKFEPPLKHVTVALAGTDDLPTYALEDDKALYIVLYRKFKIEKVYALPKDGLTEELVGKVLEDVDKLIAPRK